MMRKRSPRLYWRAGLALALAGAWACAQLPTAYPSATTSGAAQMYMESMYLPGPTTGPWAPAWSPDGNQLAFAAFGFIWEVPASGGTARQITMGPGYDSEPAWSPDGRTIAFTRDSGHAIELWRVDADGSSPRALTNNHGLNLDPEWHGRNTIYFTGLFGAKKFGLWQIAAAGGAATPVLTDGFQNVEPSSSPGGRFVVFISSRSQFANPGSALHAATAYGSGDIWKLNLATKAVEPLQREETLWQARPRWSPDGHAIVYDSYRTGSYQLVLLDPTTGIPTRLTYLQNDNALTPAWSPDSQRIAFITNAHHRFRLWTMPAVGGPPQPVHIRHWSYRRPMGTLQVRIENEDGAQTAARIYLRSSDGRNWAPPGAFERVAPETGDGYFQTDGAFSLELPAGTATIEAVKGFQYSPSRQQVSLRANSVSQVTLHLQRMADLGAAGWYSGDNHMHMNYGGAFDLTPPDLMTEMRAEDLNFINALPTNNQNHLTQDFQYFTGRADPASRPQRVLWFNEEYRPNFGGHMELLGLHSILYPVYDGYPGTSFAADYPSNAQVLDEAHRQGAWGGFAHPFLVPRGGDPTQADYGGAREFPADVVLGKVDFYDIMCDWTDPEVAASVWFRLLNLGYRIPISSGSDVMTSYWRGPAVGGVRVFVHTGNPFTSRGYEEALVHGHGFVTNGPLLSLTVDGKLPGEVISLPAGRTATLHVVAKADSIVAMDGIEIIENGRVAFRQKATDPHHLRATVALPVSGSSWIVARVLGPGPQHLLMDNYAFALTDPIYVEQAGSKFRSPQDAEYFLRWMDRSLQLLEHRTFNTPSEKQQVQAVYEKARARFAQLAKQP